MFPCLYCDSIVDGDFVEHASGCMPDFNRQKCWTCQDYNWTRYPPVVNMIHFRHCKNELIMKINSMTRLLDYEERLNKCQKEVNLHSLWTKNYVTTMEKLLRRISALEQDQQIKEQLTKARWDHDERTKEFYKE